MLQNCTFALRLVAIVSLCVISAIGASQAQENGSEKPSANVDTIKDSDEESPLKFVAPLSYEMDIGMRVTPADGNLVAVVAMTVFPCDWPEQKVEIVSVNVPQLLKHSFRDLPGNNKQLLFQANSLPARQEVEAIVRVKIEKKHIVGPEETAGFVAPRRLPKEAKAFIGSSPFIDLGLAELKRVIKEIDAEEDLTDWQRVEKYYDWVRENVVYQRGELKSTRDALKDKTGDCEELTALFVAMCRNSRVPARCVWIPNHCYAEFYLEDEKGIGFWFPCQLAGTRNFGSMPDYLPILQKGDRFKVPEKKEAERYLADYLSSKNLGRGKPKVEFIRTMLGDGANLKVQDETIATEPSEATQVDATSDTEMQEDN